MRVKCSRASSKSTRFILVKRSLYSSSICKRFNHTSFRYKATSRLMKICHKCEYKNQLCFLCITKYTFLPHIYLLDIIPVHSIPIHDSLVNLFLDFVFGCKRSFWTTSLLYYTSKEAKIVLHLYIYICIWILILLFTSQPCI